MYTPQRISTCILYKRNMKNWDSKPDLLTFVSNIATL
jgi:hypothetical protein